MISTSITSACATAGIGHLAAKMRPPGPPPHVQAAQSRAAMPTPNANATGSDPMALFESIVAHRDSDGDGQLSATEAAGGKFPNLSSKIFNVIDSDGDGLMSEAEMTTAAGMISEGISLRDLAKPVDAAP